MDTRRNEAYKLRIKGLSYNEIRAELGIPKSTLSNWLRDVVLSEAAVLRLRNRVREGTAKAFLKRNKLQTVHARTRAKVTRTSAQEMMDELSTRDLWLIGTALYWGEGYKRPKTKNGRQITSHPINFVNADEEMIRVFARYLRECLGVPHDKLRASMRLYPHISEAAARKHWMEASGIPRDRFFKTTYLVSGASKGLKPFNRLPWGTLQIEVCDTVKFYHIMGWIDGMKKQL